MVERWSNAETFAAAEVPLFVLSRLVVNDNRASDGAHRCSIKVERTVVAIQGKHSRVYCALFQYIKGYFGASK